MNRSLSRTVGHVVVVLFQIGLIFIAAVAIFLALLTMASEWITK